MITSKFLNTLKKKIDKLDIKSLRDIVVELIDENKELRTIFDSMTEGVLVIDNDQKVIFYNKRCGYLLSLSSSMVGSPLQRVIRDGKLLSIILKTIKSEDSLTEVEISLDRIYSGYFALTIRPLVRKGKIIGNIIIINDITEKKENESRLKQAESLAALTTISAGIAHEIKNPLGAVSIHVQLIQQEIAKCSCNWSEDISYSVNIIEEEIERLNDIIVKFLYTVRPLKPELMLVNLNSFFDKVVNFIKPELDSKDIRLVLNYSELPDVWIDEKYFKQAIINLVQNSISAIEEHGIIEFEIYREKNYIIINIIDNGCGIGKELQGKIFDPYFTTKSFGTGLGLTIVYKIIKEHNGEITFKSGKGETVFTIKLPVPFIEKGLIEYSGDENEH